MSDAAKIEALLFVSGDQGLSIKEIAKIINSTTDHVDVTLEKLQDKYQSDPKSGLKLLKTAETFKLVTKEQYIDIIKHYSRLPHMNKLSQALIETLAIIAYKQPITRAEIEEIRGVSITNSLQKLKLRDLIQESGRLEGPGRPVLYATTKYFLDYFGLNDLSELPELNTQKDHENTNLFNGLEDNDANYEK